MIQNIKALVIGTGVGLRTHIPSLLNFIDSRQIGILTRDIDVTNLKTNSTFGFYSSNIYESLSLWKPNLIFLGVPPYKQLEYAKELINTNAIIVFEKPVGKNFMECLNISKILYRNKTIINFQLRGLEIFQHLKNLIINDIGETVFIQIDERSSAFNDKDPSWYFNLELGGGQKLSMLTHLVDLVLYFLNLNSINEIIWSKPHNNKFLKHSCTLNMKFNATEIFLTTSSISYGPRSFNIEIIGTKGRILFEFKDGIGKCLYYGERTVSIIWEHQGEEKSLFRIAMKNYLKQILEIHFTNLSNKKNIEPSSLASLNNILNVHTILN